MLEINLERIAHQHRQIHNMSKPRVLVLTSAWPTVSELWMLRMNDELSAHLAALASYGPPPAELHTSAKMVNLTPWYWKSLAQISPRRFLRRGGAESLRRCIRSLGITHVLCHYLTCALQHREVWLTEKVSLFVHGHGYDLTWDFRNYAPPHLPRHSAAYPDQVRELSERAVIVANSNYSRGRLLEAGISEDRIALKYYGVPVPATPLERDPATQELKILYLGRLVDFKGPDLVLRSFELACQAGFRGSLIMAGTGPLEQLCQKIRAASPYADRIQLIGSINPEQGAKLRAQADIFTAHNLKGPYSNQEEAFGVSILEAMADSLPVVTGRNGGVCETVVDGTTGILVPPGDIQAQTQAFCQLQNDPAWRLALGRAGYVRAKECFTLDQERQRLYEIMGLGE